MVRPGERIHVIGIAGSGAAGVALLMHHAGLRVDGCDADTPSPYTPPLEAAGIRILSGHDPAHLEGVERVAITPALRAVPDLPELVAAHERGLPVVTWQAVLGELMTAEGRIGLAVTGTHGKSTTTALLGHLLISAGHGPDRGGRRLHRSMGSHRPPRQRSTVPGGGRRVRRQLPELPPGRGDRHQRGDGSPRLLRRSRGGAGLHGALRPRDGLACRRSAGGCC